MRPRLTFACPEQWDDMRPTDRGRFCTGCHKEVIDLTGLGDIDLLRVIQQEGGSLCGRVDPRRVARYHQLPMVTVRAPVPEVRRSGPLVPWLAAGSMLFTACDEGTIGEVGLTAPAAQQQPENGPEMPADDPPRDAPDSTSRTSPANDPVAPPSLLGEVGVMDTFVEGEIMLGGIEGGLDRLRLAEPVEQPATFPGGEDSLDHFLRARLHYPEREAQLGISGTVVVACVIDEQGHMIDPVILKDVHGAPGFAPEVLRVIGLMPVWQPALRDGRPVRTSVSLPVRFGL